MQSELISILLPVKNAETSLSDAVNSIIQQSYKNWELILINDGSSDKTPQIIESLKKTDPRIRSIHKSPLSHPSVLFRKRICKKDMWKDGDFPEDYELWLRLLERGIKMAKIPEELFLWNDPKERLSRTDTRYRDQAFYQLKSQYLAKHIQKEHENKEIWIWGAGKESKKRAQLLEKQKLKIQAWIDVDAQKVDKEINGAKIHSYKKLPSRENALILSYVGNRNAREQIKQHLQQQNWVEGKNFILCA